MKKYILILAVVLTITACKKDDNPEPRGDIIYKVTFTATWSETTHPDAYPSNAHFSPIIGLSHKATTSIFSKGELASEGIKNMAETGGTSPLDAEINALIDAEKAFDIISGSGADSPGTTNTEFGVDENNPYATVVTMIAPSPDWFIAVSNINLMKDGEWVDEITAEAISYDAGTDSGTDFTSANSPSDPKEEIYQIKDAPLGTKSLGTFTFERVDKDSN